MSVQTRSPIEVVIDEACGLVGISEEMKPKPYVGAPEDYVLAFQSVVEAAMRWSERSSEPVRELALKHACDRLRKLEEPT